MADENLALENKADSPSCKPNHKILLSLRAIVLGEDLKNNSDYTAFFS